MVNTYPDRALTPSLSELASLLAGFSAPGQPTYESCHHLHQQLMQFVPISLFAVLGQSAAGVSWLYQHALPTTWQAQIKSHPAALLDELQRLPASDGWCYLPVAGEPVLGLLAQTATDQPTLKLLLECLAIRLGETQSGARLGRDISPLLRHQPAWQQKIDSLRRVIRLAGSLPVDSFYAQLDSAARFTLNVQELLVLYKEPTSTRLVYPQQAHHALEQLASLCHDRHPVETRQDDCYWSSAPLYQQHHYLGHLLLASRSPFGPDERLLLDFLTSQLAMVMELQFIRTQLTRDDRFDQQLLQLQQTNQKLQKQLKQHQEQERRLQFDALHDPLTQLPNRAQLMSRLDQAIKHYRRHPDQPFTLLFVDVDHFKEINDTLGHMAGDQLLRQIGQRLQSCVRQNDMVARLGGDEFVIYLDDCADNSRIRQILDRIETLHAEPCLLGDHELQIELSIGVATMTPAISDISQLLHQADLAMYQAKRAGRNRNVFYSTASLEPGWLSPEQALRQALDAGQIQPYFQPVIRLKDSRLTGLEVMARWITPDGVIRDAFDFIPLAKQCGLIVELDRQILRQTCQQLSQWLAQLGDCHLKVSLNLSGRHLMSRTLLGELLECIQQYGIDPRYLVFEFNERELSRQEGNMIARLDELRAGGLQVCLDDFGSGFSSLNALFHYPVDYIKVDDSFTHRMLQSPRDLALIRAMRDISRDLGLLLIVEGIETQPEYEKLLELGCEFGQGRFIASPMPGEDILPLLGRPLNLPAH